VQNQSFDGFEGLVRRSEESDGIRIQGKNLSKSDVIELNRQTRRSAKPVTLVKKVRVMAVDSSNPQGFMITLEDIDDGEVINASMFDTIVIDRYGKIVQRAEWDKKVISVVISGRKIGDQTVEAKVVKVSRTRKS
jgi:hypothetical protein